MTDITAQRLVDRTFDTAAAEQRIRAAQAARRRALEAEAEAIALLWFQARSVDAPPRVLHGIAQMVKDVRRELGE